MTAFLDVRLNQVGGGLATTVQMFAGTNLSNYVTMQRTDLLSLIHGRNVLIGTHGFNVNRESGIACLSNWGTLLQLTQQDVFVGLLWPGDSAWAHGLDYPGEGLVANQAGDLLAPFLDMLLVNAASVSFSSHSLGARVILQTVSKMTTRVRRMILMAGAIDDDCLNTEFAGVVQKVGQISTLSSPKDDVLAFAFPLGNPFAGIVAEGHPWWHGALGLSGPASPWPANLTAPYEIPSNWGYGHHHYLQVVYPETAKIPAPVNVPQDGTQFPVRDANGQPVAGWQENWSSAFASSRFK